MTTDALMEGAFDFVLKPAGPGVAENKAALKTALADIVETVRESVCPAARPGPENLSQQRRRSPERRPQV